VHRMTGRQIVHMFELGHVAVVAVVGAEVEAAHSADTEIGDVVRARQLRLLGYLCHQQFAAMKGEPDCRFIALRGRDDERLVFRHDDVRLRIGGADTRERPRAAFYAWFGAGRKLVNLARGNGYGMRNGDPIAGQIDRVAAR